VRLTETNALELRFYVEGVPGQRALAFVVSIQPSAGTGGVEDMKVVFIEERARLSEELVLEMFDAIVTNVNGPPGAVGIRGAHDFVTPPGWDTLYSGVLNEPQQPTIPVLVARVETDWYAQPTEFRYLLQRGDSVSVSGEAPIGQVLFVPREHVALVPGSDADRARFDRSQEEYWAERHAREKATNFGTTYSRYYRDLQRSQPRARAE
jgi:hypothetical protein